MTANEDALDLDVLEAELPLHYFDCERFNVTDYGTRQGKCDCTATEDIRSLIAEVAELRSARASIGPDSERIRELEAENAELRRRLAASQSSPEWTMVRCPTCGQIAPPHTHQNFVMP